jgi:soluble lytic murein transglycosylase-like protein
MKLMIGAFLVLMLSFFTTNSVDPAIDHNAFKKDVILQAIELDTMISISYRMEHLYINALQLDYKLGKKFEKTYTDDELRKLSYDQLLPISDQVVKRKLALTKNIKHRRKELIELTKAVAREQNISPTLFVSLVKAESDFNHLTISKANAHGLCQIIPENFKHLNITDPFDELQNLRGGSKFLRNLLIQFEGNISISLAAYNAGPGAIIDNKIPPYKETIEYVKRVIKYFQEYKKG